MRQPSVAFARPGASYFTRSGSFALSALASFSITVKVGTRRTVSRRAR
jgi:hypothetical protein